MKKFTSNEIRNIWLEFFAAKGHKIIPSAPLVPINDPTLLWINAGVAPLKKYFDGTITPENRRMVNVQKSIRTNDIENVGKTARHHTFFEMLGNFSIGDYFRDDALTWALEILTDEKYYNFPIDKLYFTIHTDDDESYNKWIELGVDKNKIFRLDGNFWEIGEGPCGPNTEIFYDRGIKYDKENLGTKLIQEEIENDRYIEVWNIVFSQYNAVSGVKRENYKELPSKNIDTGMGLERMACVLQEVETNYETDLFMPIINGIEALTKTKYTGQMAFKVIADHLRSVSFAIADGAMFSNEGRGYVLRRLLRRAVRFGKKLNMNEAFLFKLVKVVGEVMQDFYPEVLEKQASIEKLIKLEEERFLQTLEAGEKKLLEYLNNSKTTEVDRKEAFLLYDTFGFPIELTIEVASEAGFSVDVAGFNEELQKQKELSRASRVDDYKMNTQNEAFLKFKTESKFVGYDSFKIKSKIIAIFKDGNLTNSANGEALLVFEETPFYGESGGQVGDKGLIKHNDHNLKVLDSIKLPNDQNASIVDLEEETIEVGMEVTLEVDINFRNMVIKNHTATHLLNEALRKVLGGHVKQLGSYVGSSSLRFDFNNYNFPTNEELLEVEAIVNEEINKAIPVDIKYYPLEEAKQLGVQAVFGEKYGEVVRVVSTLFSKELCGGCHVENTKDIEAFAILAVESKGSGVYRIEASTANSIKAKIEETLYNINNEIKILLNKKTSIILEAKELGLELRDVEINFNILENSYRSILTRKEELENLREIVKELDKELNKLKRESSVINLDSFLSKLKKKDKYNILITDTHNLDINLVKDLVDRLSDKLDDSFIFIANKTENNIVFVCKSKIKSLHAGLIVKEAAIIAGGAGGGRPDFAQAGGRDISKLLDSINKVNEIVSESL